MARAPEVFSLGSEPKTGPAKRNDITVTEAPDVFAEIAAAPAEELPRGSGWLRLFVSSILGFLALAIGVQTWTFIVGLASSNPLLAYLALGLVALAVLALLVLLVREISAVLRFSSVVKLRKEAEAAAESHDRDRARAFVSAMSAFYAKDPGSARARTALTEHMKDIIDAPDLVNLAERELLGAKDQAARSAIAAAASKVAMVTTISPRAWVDVAFVLAQGVRLIRQVATIYSGRPGGLALWRLSARVATHLAITGGIAVAQDAIGQVLGAGIVARLSSKLGEGVLNGVLTARVGLSAIAVCRPMPFRALDAPVLSDVAGSLLSGKSEEKPAR
ncbi:MAG: TIGR01620 family protein [Proteobacteria bacterium]|nr:TIGR01620 family protein [Pseudomonadota bacterium]